MNRRVVADVTLAVFPGAVGAVLGAVALMRTLERSSSPSSNGGALASGNCTDGASGTPHYHLTVIATGGHLNGAVGDLSDLPPWRRPTRRMPDLSEHRDVDGLLRFQALASGGSLIAGSDPGSTLPIAPAILGMTPTLEP